LKLNNNNKNYELYLLLLLVVVVVVAAAAYLSGVSFRCFCLLFVRYFIRAYCLILGHAVA
jgi:uncharacterized protein (UPF0333 family)